MREDADFTSLHVSLPKTERVFVEAEAARSGCTTSSEYIRRLIHDAQRRAEREDLERKLIAGLESGAASELPPDYWEQKRRELAERHSRKSR